MATRLEIYFLYLKRNVETFGVSVKVEILGRKEAAPSNVLGLFIRR
jgi:hypothetical protein